MLSNTNNNSILPGDALKDELKATKQAITAADIGIGKPTKSVPVVSMALCTLNLASLNAPQAITIRHIIQPNPPAT